MHVIVLGGMARVGKTDVADMLEMEGEMEGFNVVRVSFASPLKEAVAKEHGHDDWRKFKEQMPEVYRDECQRIGAEKREQDPEHWVNLWCESLQKLMNEELERPNTDLGWEETLVIVDDCRYPNELEAAKKFHALTMFVYAGARCADLPEADADWRAHESEEMSQKIEAHLEGYQDLFEWSLFNDKDLPALDKKIQDRLKNLLGLTGARFGRVCPCNECKAFRADIQVEEIVEQFREALAAIFEDDTIDEETRDVIRDSFEDIIDDLESGKASPMDFFRSGWWEKAFEDKENNDEDSDDSSA